MPRRAAFRFRPECFPIARSARPSWRLFANTARTQRRVARLEPPHPEKRYWIAPQRLLKLPVGTVGVAPLIRLDPLAADCRVGVWAACGAGTAAGASSA